MREFGTRLARARKTAGFTQRQVASYLNVCTASVSNWESGNNYPAVEMIPDLCKMLKIDANYLFGITAHPGATQTTLELEQVHRMAGQPVFLRVDWGEGSEYDFLGWGVIHTIHSSGVAIQFNGRYHFLLDSWYANPDEVVTWVVYATTP